MEDRNRCRLTADEAFAAATVQGVRVAPDGRHLAAIVQQSKTVEIQHSSSETETGAAGLRTQVVADVQLIPLDGGPARPLLSGLPAVTALSWSPQPSDSPRLALYRHGEQTLEVLALGEPSARVILRRELLHPGRDPYGDRGDEDRVDPRWSPDGECLLVGVRVAGETQLLEVAANGSGWRRRFATPGTLIGWDWSPDGRRVVAVAYREEVATADVFVVDLTNDEARCVGVERDTFYLDPVARWSPRGYLVLRSNRSGWAKLWAVDPETGSARPLTDGPWDEGAFRIAPDGRIVFASGRDQPGLGTDLWVLDPDREGDATRLTHHPGVNTPLGWAADGSVVYWHTSGAEIGDVWVVSANGEPPKPLTSSTSMTLAAKLATPQVVTIPAEDGPLAGLLHRPGYYQDGERYPSIVWIHGGPTMAARPGWNPTTALCSWLANEGFVVLNVAYRGSTGHGVAHMEAIAGAGVGKHDLADVVSAAAFLRDLPEVNTVRGIGVGGRSWGGYLTLMALTNRPDVFACGFASVGISDWAIQQPETIYRYYDYWLLGGWAYDLPELVADRSPITRVGDIAAPVLISHGELDQDVPFRQITAFVAAARAAGKDVEAHFHPHERHSLQLRQNQQDELERISRFFRCWLHPWDFRDNPTGDQLMG